MVPIGEISVIKVAEQSSSVAQIRAAVIDGCSGSSIYDSNLWLHGVASEAIRIEKIHRVGVAVKNSDGTLTSKTEANLLLDIRLLNLCDDSKSSLLSLREADLCMVVAL